MTRPRLGRLPLGLLVLSALLAGAVAQTRLSDQLFLEFLPPNGAASALTPPNILFAETPIVIRYTLIGGIAVYEPQAACHPTALSFFATRDRIPPSLCNEETNAVIRVYTLYHALLKEFPAEMDGFRNFLLSLDLDPVTTSRDISTVAGWAFVHGNRLADFFARDGWNSLGDRSNPFPQRFQDYTAYRPVNCPQDDPARLLRPLRWQPFMAASDSPGRFTSQVHVVPQIAELEPLVLSGADVAKRRASAPYRAPNARRRISAPDLRTLRRLTAQLIRVSRDLTSQQRFLAEWWNNKLFSTAAVSSFYEKAARLSRFEIAQQFMGEMLSQYDALLITWREKRRHDLARPRTLLQSVRRGQRFRAFVSEDIGVRTVRAEDWRPLIPEQPHSEFPSASAAVCRAAMEHINLYVEEKLGRKAPPIKIRFPAIGFTFSRRAMTVSFANPLTAADSCAESRLWAGVHLQPAVDAGKKIGTGVGEIVFKHIKQLGAGIVPPGCKRCRKQR